MDERKSNVTYLESLHDYQIFEMLQKHQHLHERIQYIHEVVALENVLGNNVVANARILVQNQKLAQQLAMDLGLLELQSELLSVIKKIGKKTRERYKKSSSRIKITFSFSENKMFQFQIFFSLLHVMIFLYIFYWNSYQVMQVSVELLLFSDSNAELGPGNVEQAKK